MEKFVESVHNRVRVELTCEVHAVPRAYVTWYKDNMLLDPSSTRLMQSTDKRYKILQLSKVWVYNVFSHKLILHNLAVTDFGNYSCRAENSFGKKKAFIFLSGNENPTLVLNFPGNKFSNVYITSEVGKELFRGTSSPSLRGGAGVGAERV